MVERFKPFYIDKPTASMIIDLRNILFTFRDLFGELKGLEVDVSEFEERSDQYLTKIRNILIAYQEDGEKKYMESLLAWERQLLEEKIKRAEEEYQLAFERWKRAEEIGAENVLELYEVLQEKKRILEELKAKL